MLWGATHVRFNRFLSVGMKKISHCLSCLEIGKVKIILIYIRRNCRRPSIYIWHDIFGRSVCKNDLTVINASAPILPIVNATFPLLCKLSHHG